MRAISLHGIDGSDASTSDESPLHGLADLEQPDPHGVEHQIVGEGPALEVRVDGGDGGGDVREPLRIAF